MCYCYYCNEELTFNNDHFEHIIPQSIGGRLTSKGILCNKCGEVLGREVDAPFFESFEIINQFFDIKRDRGKGRSKAFEINIDEFKIEVQCKKGSLVPIKNYKDSKNKIIYLKEKKEINLEKSLAYLLDGDSLNSFKIVYNVPPTHYLNTIAGSIGSDEAMIHNGLLKIAIEYALYNGIDINELSLVFDRKKKKFNELLKVIHYFPLSFFEESFDSTLFYFGKEYLRGNTKTKATSYFPFHMLKLFSVKNKLYCYINLYSFYECYVLLSDNYTQNTHSTYLNPICHMFPDYYSHSNAHYLDPKNLHITSQHFNIPIQDLERVTRMLIEQYPNNKIDLYKKIPIENKFVNNCNRYFANVFDKFSQSLRLVQVNFFEQIPDSVRECLVKIDKDLKDEDNMISFMTSRMLFAQRDDIDFASYKVHFMNNWSKKITPIELLRLEEEIGTKNYNDRLNLYRKQTITNALLSSEELFKEYEREVEIDEQKLLKTEIDNLFFQIRDL